MELVYLWVKDYKNIKSQGFNFSPRFECKFHDEYDEKGKLKDNCKLEIIEKKENEYIKDFFGDNINVTAIVGKNGSGKSSLLALFDILKQSLQNTEPVTSHPAVIIILKNGDTKLEYYSSYDLIMNTLENIYVEKIDFHIMLNKLTMNQLTIKNIDDDTNSFSRKYISIFLKYHTILEKLEVLYNFTHLKLSLKNNSSKFLENLVESESKHSFISDMNNNSFIIVPDKNNYDIETIQKQYRINKCKHWIEERVVEYKKSREEIVELVKKIEQIYLRPIFHNSLPTERTYSLGFEVSFLIAFIEYFLKNTRVYNPISDFIFEKLSEAYNQMQDENEKRLSSDIAFPLMDENYEFLDEFLKKLEENKTFNPFFDKGTLTLEEIILSIKKLKNINTANNYMKEIDITLNEDYQNVEKDIKIFSKQYKDSDFENAKNETSLRLYEWNLVNKNTNAIYETLSDGERQFLNVMIELFHILEEQFIYPWTENKLFVIMADEIENSLHPLWKRNLLNETLSLCKIINNYESNAIHLLLTTHSPFLLSDIPKQNIIFLDTYEDGKCKVLHHDEVMDKKQTFGQNIHTLLSDSFFMEDGLMGEFAKGKINEIIEFHKEVEEIKDNESARNTLRTKYEIEEDEKPSIKTKFWNTQSIIGDEYLKQVIKNHLVDMETILLGHDTAKKEEIERLRAEADRLERLS